jgi:hypothetical protein
MRRARAARKPKYQSGGIIASDNTKQSCERAALMQMMQEKTPLFRG